MRLYITVPCDAENLFIELFPGGETLQKIIVDGVAVLDICKVHNHRYDFKAFFYRSKRIVTCCSYSSKLKLHGAIQKLLQEELHGDVQ